MFNVGFKFKTITANSHKIQKNRRASYRKIWYILEKNNFMTRTKYGYKNFERIQFKPLPNMKGYNIMSDNFTKIVKY